MRTSTQTLRDKIIQLLEANRVDIHSKYTYTKPAPKVYEQQWLWDSCFHAIVQRWIDPEMAKRELLTVVAHQVDNGTHTGMIPHMNYWDNAGSELWGIAHRSIITQPPIIAYAAVRIYEVSPDKDFLFSLYEPLSNYHHWLRKTRDPDNDNLVSIIHPWESGWDASQRWDRILKLNKPTDDASKLERVKLVLALKTYDCDPNALEQQNYFSVEAIDFNNIRATDIESLAAIAKILGKDDDSMSWKSIAKKIQGAIHRKMVLENYYDLTSADEIPIRVNNAAKFISLFGGSISHREALELVKKLQSHVYWPHFGITTTPTSSDTFDPNRYWRGNVWPCVNWLIYKGLKRYHFDDVAKKLARNYIDLVLENGFWEYYNPLTGQGLGAKDCSWAALVLDLAIEENL